MFAIARPCRIGVDIGTATVKIAQVRRRSGAFELVAASVVPRLDAPSSQSDDFPRPVAEDLRAAFAACDALEGTTTNATVSMSACEYFSEDLGLDNPEYDPEATAVTLLEQNRVPLQDNEYDYWTSGGGSKAQLHVVASSTGLMEQVAAVHRESGVTCRLVDGPPLAVAKAVRQWAGTGNQPIAALDWGYRAATFCVVTPTEVAFVRTLPGTGYCELLHSVCSGFGVSEDEARRILVKTGLSAGTGSRDATELEQELALVLRDPLAHVAGELQKTLQYLNSYRRDLATETLVLMGGGATVAGVDVELGQHLPLSCAKWDFPVGAEAHVPNQTLPLFAQAIALSCLR